MSPTYDSANLPIGTVIIKALSPESHDGWECQSCGKRFPIVIEIEVACQSESCFSNPKTRPHTVSKFTPCLDCLLTKPLIVDICERKRLAPGPVETKRKEMKL